MKVSIITVCFNSEKTIADTINSVINQSYKNIEYIIVDGCSSDLTLKIIEEYKSHISIFISEKDRGLYDAMNKGIQLATGDIICLLNSDDVYFDSKVIQEVINLFKNNSSLDVIYGDLVYVKKDNTNKIVRKWYSSEYSKNYFEFGHVPPHPTLFLRTYVFKQVGEFNLNYKFASDYDFMLRLFKKFSFNSFYYNRFIIKMRLGGATNSSLSNIIKGNIEIIQSWKNNKQNLFFYTIPLKILRRVLQFI